MRGETRVGLTTPAPPPGATWGPEIAVRPGDRACGVRNIEGPAAEESRIVNGWETVRHEYPWQVQCSPLIRATDKWFNSLKRSTLSSRNDLFCFWKAAVPCFNIILTLW